MTLPGALLELLKRSAALAAIVGDRFVPVVAPQDMKRPLVVMTGTLVEFLPTLSGRTGVKQRYQFDVIADPQDHARAYSARWRIFEVLQGTKQQVGGLEIHSISAEGSPDLPEEPVRLSDDVTVIRLPIQFLIHYNLATED